MKISSIVSVPSFGDSFFIRRNALRSPDIPQQFPSPHSGILFLLGYNAMYDKPSECVSVPSFGDSFFILSL